MACDPPCRTSAASEEISPAQTRSVAKKSVAKLKRAIRLSAYAKELLHRAHLRRLLVIRQAVDEHAAVLLLQNAVVEQHQQSAIVQRANEASEALLQGDHGRRHL